MGKKDKDKDVTPRERLEDERLIRKLREDEKIQEQIRKDAEERDKKNKGK